MSHLTSRRGCRRCSSDSIQKSSSQDNRSTDIILPHQGKSASSRQWQAMKEDCPAASCTGEVAPPVRPAARVAMRFAGIWRGVSADLKDLARTEQAQFPRIVRLLVALKQTAAKVSIELVSLATAYPEISAVGALLAFAWFYVSAEVEGPQ